MYHAAGPRHHRPPLAERLIHGNITVAWYPVDTRPLMARIEWTPKPRLLE